MFGRKKTRGKGVDADSSTQSEGQADLDAVSTESGPLNRYEVEDVDAHFKELGMAYVDLGAMVIGVPKGRDINVTINQQNQAEFHVVSKIARSIPHVYSAPKSPGQWRSWIPELRTSLESQGAECSIEDGPFGRELYAALPSASFRAVGCEGPRWMAEVRVMSAPENAEAAAEEAREVLRHLVIERNSEPMPVREHLKLNIPEEVEKALLQAQAQAKQQVQAQRQQQAQAQQGAGQQGQAPQQQAQAPQQPGQAPQQQPNVRPRRDGSAMDSLRDDEI